MPFYRPVELVSKPHLIFIQIKIKYGRHHQPAGRQQTRPCQADQEHDPDRKIRLFFAAVRSGLRSVRPQQVSEGGARQTRTFAPATTCPTGKTSTKTSAATTAAV